MSDKILVLGARGTIGSLVVDALLARGAQVRAASRTAEGLARPGVEVVPFDFNLPATHRPALKGVGRVFLLTPISPETEGMTERIVEAAVAEGVSKIVKLSAYGQMTFARWHARAEAIVQRSGIPYVFLRPNGFMQNFLVFHGERVRRENGFALPAGDARVSYIDGRDLARTAVRALMETGLEGKRLQLTGPEALSHHEIASIFSEVLERPIRYLPLDPVAARESMERAGRPPWLTEASASLYTFYRAGGAEAIAGDARIPFRDFVKDHRARF